MKILKYTASLFMTATLHHSDFCQQNGANKTNSWFNTSFDGPLELVFYPLLCCPCTHVSPS
jgi:hypothetical protein